MKTVTFTRESVNLSALDEQLRHTLGSAFKGISTGNGQLTVYLVPHADPSHLAQTIRILEEHDPHTLTDSQTRTTEEKARLMSERAKFAQPLVISGEDAPTDIWRHLAQRVAWLEREWRFLVGDNR